MSIGEVTFLTTKSNSRYELVDRQARTEGTDDVYVTLPQRGVAGLLQQPLVCLNICALLAAAAIVLSSEAITMGVKAGLNPSQMCDIINSGSGRNSATQDKFPRAILPGSFDFGFTTGLAYKDIRLCVNEAEALGVPMIVGAAVREMMAVTNAKFGPESDFTSIARVIEEWAGVEMRTEPHSH